MAYSIASNTRLAGSPQGTFLDDLTSPTVGQWPKTQAIKKINSIVVYTGDVVDSLRITYDVENNGVISPVTVRHGGTGGSQTLSFNIGGNTYLLVSKFLFTPGTTLLTVDDKLLAVYGSRLLNSSLYGDKTITKLSFVVANYTGSAPTVQVYTASGLFATPAQNAKFDLSWPLTAATSYSYQPTGLDRAFVQAIGFSNALDKASSTFL
ncbi:hypothetical protein EDB83DRAFT_2323412 [Lactarius deliciosus]|nr:hypothetical protein EDB83DRAFT_2323412 [Lactarius deliciosus]